MHLNIVWEKFIQETDKNTMYDQLHHGFGVVRVDTMLTHSDHTKAMM